MRRRARDNIMIVKCDMMISSACDCGRVHRYFYRRRRAVNGARRRDCRAICVEHARDELEAGDVLTLVSNICRCVVCHRVTLLHLRYMTGRELR